MKFGVILLAIAFLITPAQARHRHHNHIMYGEEYVVSHPSNCPWYRFCGCGVCVKIGIPASTCKKMGLFLAANWGRKFPHASPAPGMVAYRDGHVMYIMAMDANGNATVYDPNSGGHQTRIHTRSLAGYRIVNPNG